MGWALKRLRHRLGLATAFLGQRDIRHALAATLFIPGCFSVSDQIYCQRLLVRHIVSRGYG